MDAQVEKLAKLIAFWHGQKMVVNSKTVATLHGYGQFGDSSERYMHAHWQEYVSAAEAVIREFEPEVVAVVA